MHYHTGCINQNFKIKRDNIWYTGWLSVLTPGLALSYDVLCLALTKLYKYEASSRVILIGTRWLAIVLDFSSFWGFRPKFRSTPSGPILESVIENWIDLRY